MAILFVRFFSSSKQPLSVPQPSPSIQASITPFNSLQIESFDKDYQRITSKKELSISDQKVKNKLIASLGNKSGILTQTNTYKIEYLKSPDYFMAELNSSEIETTKSEVIDWLKQQGLDAQGICNLPLVFYLGQEISANFRSSNLEFNPNPQGCQ